MRENKWENVWDNSIKHYWKEKREEYAWQLAHIQRRGGMNFSQQPIEQGAEGDALGHAPQ